MRGGPIYVKIRASRGPFVVDLCFWFSHPGTKTPLFSTAPKLKASARGLRFTCRFVFVARGPSSPFDVSRSHWLGVLARPTRPQHPRSARAMDDVHHRHIRCPTCRTYLRIQVSLRCEALAERAPVAGTRTAAPSGEAAAGHGWRRRSANNDSESHRHSGGGCLLGSGGADS